MSPQDFEYYRKRAQEERQRAADAEFEQAAKAHEQLAIFYEKLLELDGDHRDLSREPPVSG